jgi:hypothetical protein
MVFAQFKNSLADRGAVTEQSCLEAPQADSHPRLDLLVVNGLKPLRERHMAIFRLVSEEFEHRASVAYKLHPHK